MMSRRLSWIIGLALLIVAASATGTRVGAQQPPTQTLPAAATEAPPASYDTPPAITTVDGSARLLRQGQSQAAVVNMPLIEGDRIVADGGRVAVTFPDGSLLHIDRGTTVDFLSMSLLRLHDGRVILVAAGRGDQRSAVDYQIDAAAGSVRVQTAGEYKVALLSAREVELDVVSGVAALATDRDSVQVEAGERAFAMEGQAPSFAEAFNSARLDEFDQWSESQRDAQVGSAASAQYLPADLRVYSNTFDNYGRWENDASYGYVWYPSVSVGWRPYYNGYWDSVGPYGWTWIGYDPWCWPTQHFGRWGFRAGLWFWVPGYHWGPAWVSWGYASGYYGWCPLDYYNRAVIGFGYYGGHYDPWRCWTVVPHGRFGHGYAVPRYALDGARLPASARNAFAMRRSGPEIGGAMARAGTGGAPRAMARALPNVSMQARPRESMFAAGQAMPRGAYAGSATPRASQRAGVATTAPRYDTRSLPYAAAPRSNGSSASRAVPRDSMRPATPYANGTSPAYRATPRGSDRPPSGYSVQPRGSDRPPSSYSAQPRGSDRPPSSYSAQPRGSDRAPSGYSAQPRGSNRPPSSYSAQPRYQAPSYHYGTPPQTTPRYSTPPASRYSAPSYRPAPSAPRYSAPSYSAPAPRSSAPSYSAPAPRYSAPSYSAPSPRYSAPSPSAAPRYSAPPSSAPRGPSGGGSAAPRAGGASAPHGGGSGAARPAPRSGGGGRGR